MGEPCVMRLADLQPSQLYLNEAKVASVKKEAGALPPLPVKRLGGRVVLTDGHTRAFVAWQAGRAEVEVEWDRDELDWEAYELCVAWCEAEGIHTVADLAHRIVPPEEYAVVWLERCARMQRRLAAERAGK
jgi:hypothetical protein